MVGATIVSGAATAGSATNLHGESTVPATRVNKFENQETEIVTVCLQFHTVHVLPRFNFEEEEKRG